MSDEAAVAETLVETDLAATALRLILEQQTELFVNLAGQPTIGLRITVNSETHAWPLRSERVKAWIAEVCWDRLSEVLSEREIDRIITVLIGRAWHDLRTTIAVNEAVEQDPLLDALVIFMHQNPVFEKPCTALYSALNKVARANGFDTRDRLWPKGAPQLSRRLGELQGLLVTAGIKAEVGRQSSGVRYVRLMRSQSNRDDDGRRPSEGSSIDKSHHPKKLGFADAADGDSDVFSKIETRTGGVL